MKDTFTWSRVWLIARYMYPSLRKQIIFYPVLSALFGVLAQVFFSLHWSENTSLSLFSNLVSLMFYLAPLSLAHRDNRFIVSQLPATTSEKFVFLILYYWVAIFCITSVVYNAMIYISGLFFSNPSDLALMYMQMIFSQFDLSANNMALLSVVGMFAAIALQTLTLWGVVKAKASRMLTGIGSLVIGYVAMSVVSGIIGVVIAVKVIRPFMNQAAESSCDLSETEFLKVFMNEAVLPITVFVSALMVIAAAIILTKIYKKIKHSGF